MNENEVKKWIVFVHVGGYRQHDNMIGNIVKKNIVKKNRFGKALKKDEELKPATDAFSEIANGDIVVY